MPDFSNEALFPLDENARLDALLRHQILDTPPETDFDALTRLAVHVLDVPMAAIGLMDRERLWFKSRIGLDEPELARPLAWWADPVATAPGAPETVAVHDDLRTDPQHASHPWVQGGPRARFHASVTLRDGDGHALGTLFVMDTQARTLDARQRRALTDLGALAATTLQNRLRALQLRHLAMTDHLTGLYNRVQFERALEAELGHGMRTGEPFAVLLLDLDGFKAVNDGFGHAAGDFVLKEVSARIQQQVRQGDVLARLGGDEFGVVVRHGNAEAAEALSRRIVQAVAQPVTLSSQDVVGVGVSIGLACFDSDVMSARALLAQADQALYQAKQRNDRRWKMYMGLRA